MELKSEHVEFMNDHRFGVLSTGRRDGSPQASMVGYFFDGDACLITFRRGTAKYHNIKRQPRVVLSAADGRRVLTIYGNGELIEDDPARVNAFQTILMSYGLPETPAEDLIKTMEDEQRVVLRLRPSAIDLHE